MLDGHVSTLPRTTKPSTGSREGLSLFTPKFHSNSWFSLEGWGEESSIQLAVIYRQMPLNLTYWTFKCKVGPSAPWQSVSVIQLGCRIIFHRIHPLGTKNVCTKSCVTPSCRCWDVSQDNYSVWLAGGPGWKAKNPQIQYIFILLGTWIHANWPSDRLTIKVSISRALFSLLALKHRFLRSNWV